LNYDREDILESFYTLHTWRGIYPAFGVQYVVPPGIQRGSRAGGSAHIAVAFGVLGKFLSSVDPKNDERTDLKVGHYKTEESAEAGDLSLRLGHAGARGADNGCETLG